MILDTNARSALADGSSAFAAAAASADVLSLPVVALGEYLYGIARSRHRRRYETWLAKLLEVCPVLAVDHVTAARYATIRQALRERGRPISSNDAWIAALALQHGLPLLSRDTHFDVVRGVHRVDW